MTYYAHMRIGYYSKVATIQLQGAASIWINTV